MFLIFRETIHFIRLLTSQQSFGFTYNYPITDYFSNSYENYFFTKNKLTLSLCTFYTTKPFYVLGRLFWWVVWDSGDTLTLFELLNGLK